MGMLGGDEGVSEDVLSGCVRRHVNMRGYVRGIRLCQRVHGRVHTRGRLHSVVCS